MLSLQPQLSVFLLAVVSCVSASDGLLPAPQGPYNTTLSTAELVDHARQDPYARNTTRALMVSVFTPIPPAKCTSLSSVAYMPAETADFYDELYGSFGIPAGTFGSFSLPVCTAVSPKYRIPDYPILIFSPGLGNSRLLYSGLAQSLASSGFIVVTIDHPHDADIVTFPTGSSVLAASISSDAEIEAAVAVRTDDIAFVVSQLRNSTVTKSLIPNAGCGSLDTTRIGVLGHSLGGATALAALTDSRTHTLAGANLDGTFFGPSIRTGTSRPFLLVGHTDKNQSTDESWSAAWANFRGWRAELEVVGTQHGSFTDLPTLLELLGLGGALPQLLGTLEAARGLEIVRVYVAAFFGFVLGGGNAWFLERYGADFPEVRIVDQ